MRLLALTRGVDLPSSRFRVRQLVAPLRERGVEVVERTPRVDPNLLYFGLERRLRRRQLLPLAAAQLALDALARLPDVLLSGRYDATLVQRSLVPGFEPLVRLLRGRRILDVDDAIWLEGLGGRQVPFLARSVDEVIAGNAFLAEYFSAHCPRVHVVPTAVDVRRLAVKRKETGAFTVGWTGTSGNFPYLGWVGEPLRQFLARHPDARFLAIADRNPQLVLGVPDVQMAFRPWSRETEVSGLAEMDVGIMPLEDGAWARGKCSFKMLQYMAASLPVVVSPVGMNQEVLGLGEVGFGPTTAREWLDALETLYSEREAGREMGRRGRTLVERRFSVERVAAMLEGILRGGGRHG